MAVDMFLKLEGIKGESQDQTHGGQIDVLAWSFGGSQSGTGHMGGGSGGGKVNIQDISLTKYVDKASATLFLKMCDGKHISKGTLICRKAGEKPVEYLKITMEDILVAGYSTGGSGGQDRLTENVTLNFSKFKIEYTPQKKDGSTDPVVDMKWDIAANAPA